MNKTDFVRANVATVLAGLISRPDGAKPTEHIELAIQLTGRLWVVMTGARPPAPPVPVITARVAEATLIQVGDDD